MRYTKEELEAMRLADEELEREWTLDATERALNAEIDKWLDDMAIEAQLSTADAKKRRDNRRYYEAHKDEIAEYQRRYRKDRQKKEEKQGA